MSQKHGIDDSVQTGVLYASMSPVSWYFYFIFNKSRFKLSLMLQNAVGRVADYGPLHIPRAWQITASAMPVDVPGILSLAENFTAPQENVNELMLVVTCRQLKDQIECLVRR